MAGLNLVVALCLANLLTGSAGAPTPASHNRTVQLQFITIEEHYDLEIMIPYQTGPVIELLGQALGNATAPLIGNINGSRLHSMDANGIRVQVISSDPTPQALDKPMVVRAANEKLATQIAPYPDRFRAFCFLPMTYPQLAANELERCVSQPAFVGALVDSHLPDYTSYDGPEYDILWDTFERLGVPIYLHPTYPPIAAVNETGGLYTSSKYAFPDTTAAILGTSGWGWHSDCGVQFLKLWLAGVFDRHPGLKLVLGHMGEMLPYMLARSSYELNSTKSSGVTLRDAYTRNVWVTTSGFFSLDPFAALLRTTAGDRIMYSVDYPWATNEDGTAFMEALRSSGMVSAEEWDNIAFRNAELLLEMH